MTPSFVHATRAIAAKDLRLEWRNWDAISSGGALAMVVLVVLHVALGLGDAGRASPALTAGAVWTALAFAATVGLVRSFQLELPGDPISGLLAAPVDRSAIFCGKLLANGVKIALLQLLLVSASAVFFRADWISGGLSSVAALGVHGFGLTCLGTLTAAVATRLGRGESLAATLTLPAATPLLLSAVRVTELALAAEPLWAERHWLYLSSGFGVLYLLVGSLVFEWIIEE